MNRGQGIALLVATLNLLLLLLFPPYDYLSLERGNVPTFSGFSFVLAAHVSQRINMDFLVLEIIVVLVNAAIAFLLLRPRSESTSTLRSNRNQRILLAIVALNLVVMLLFPPFENFIAVTKAAIPSFEGFFFIFADNSQRQIVTPLLYLEIALVLINGGLLWLVLKERKSQPLSANEKRELAQRLQSVHKR